MATTVQLYLPASLYAALQADAKALGIPTSTIGSMLLADAMERARARRYAPYHLPEGYRFEHDNVRPFKGQKEAQG